MKIDVFIIFLSTLILSCTNKETELQKFKIFELAYSNGWDTDFKIIIDSTHKYYTPSDSNVKSYLPDSVVNLLNTSISLIKKDTSIVSYDFNCKDCRTVPIKIAFQRDSIQIVQKGSNLPLHPVIGKLIANLRSLANHIETLN